VVRKLSEEIKDKNAKKGIACSSAGFSRQAITFSEGRLIELLDKSKLNQLLGQSGI
jgi:hypothetical protein